MRRFLPFLFLPILLVFSLQGQVSSDTGMDEFARAEKLRYQHLAGRLTTVATGENIDVLHYDIDVTVDDVAQTIGGSVRITARTTFPNVTSLTLNLSPAMVLDSVLLSGSSVTATRTGSVFAVPVAPSAAQGDILVITVYYHGTPPTSGFGSFAFSSQPNSTTPWIWTLSEPYGAPDWWPCKDTPTDKADSIDIRITCAQNLKAASQGRLISVVSHQPGKLTYHWRHRYPIATYLVSITLTEYAEFSNWFVYGPTDSMEVVHYVLPSQLGLAQSLLPNVISMLEIFSNLFGLYPFITEKYGHAQFGWGGGMEHQTMTSLGGFSENLVAHELAHQWFGDMITMASWSDIWLNEGFATYSVALYHEAKTGPAPYRSYMASQFGAAINASGTLFVTDTANIASLFNSNLVYAKGAVVLHMLRHVVGDSAFFNALKLYATNPRFRFSNASTADVQEMFEQASAMDLNYFFEQWIYGEGYPRYVFSWNWQAQSQGALVEFSLMQSTSSQNPSFFRMPVDVRLTGPAGDTTIVVFNDSLEQTWTWSLPFIPLTVRIDPDSWILKSVEEVTVVPTEVVLSQNYPNPFNASTTFEFFVPERSRVTVEILNLLGEVVDVLDSGDRDRGYHVVLWSPRTASGVYFCRLTAVSANPPHDTKHQIRRVVYLK